MLSYVIPSLQRILINYRLLIGITSEIGPKQGPECIWRRTQNEFDTNLVGNKHADNVFAHGDRPSG